MDDETQEFVLDTKPEVVPEGETKEERMKRLNISDLPGHTWETEQIQKAREEELANQAV